MPQRIDLRYDVSQSAEYDLRCDICNEPTQGSYCSYFSPSGGEKYADSWRHPLTYYEMNNKDNSKNKKDTTYSAMQVSQYIFTYDYFPVFVLGCEYNNTKYESAFNVQSYNECISSYAAPQVFEQFKSLHTKLWLSGYEIDKERTKVAKSWYSQYLPMFNIEPEYYATFQACVTGIVKIARHAFYSLRKHIKQINTDLKKEVCKISEDDIHTEFWRSTEASFYDQILQLYDIIHTRALTHNEIVEWMHYVSKTALELYDKYTGLQNNMLCCNIDYMKVIIKNRNELKWSLSEKTNSEAKDGIIDNIINVMLIESKCESDNSD
jgi:hypothetical protein